MRATGASSTAVMKTMLRSADVLADLVREARGDAEVEDERLRALTEELAGLSESPAAPPAPAQAVSEDDPFGFQPLTLSFDDFSPAEEPTATGWRIFFKPAPDLYRRGNEPARILRELGRLGEMTAQCDAAALPMLDDFDRAYLAWTLDLVTDAPRAAIEDVFDFVVDDCVLALAPLRRPKPRSF